MTLTSVWTRPASNARSFSNVFTLPKAQEKGEFHQYNLCPIRNKRRVETVFNLSRGIYRHMLSTLQTNETVMQRLTCGFGQVGRTQISSSMCKLRLLFWRTNKAGHLNESMNF